MPFRSATHPIVLAQGVPCELRDRLRGGGFVRDAHLDLDCSGLSEDLAPGQRPLPVGAFSPVPT
jgi:hypothetical protein